MADDTIADLRGQLEILRELVAASGVPVVWGRGEARGSTIVRCGICRKYLRQNHVRHHFDCHQAAAVNPMSMWQRR